MDPVTVPRADWRPPSRARVAGLRARLRDVYGVPVMEPHGDALAELVLTVLSQSTNDRNRDAAYLQLRERLPSWEAVRDAPVEEVEAAIQPGGLHVQKSRRLQEILRGAARASSTSPGCATPPCPRAGRSCARCRASGARPRRASCSSPSAPATCRWTRTSAASPPAWACCAPGAGSEEQHDAMVALTPRGAELELHVNLLRHGRRTCHARVPACAACALRRACPSRRT